MTVRSRRRGKGAVLVEFVLVLPLLLLLSLAAIDWGWYFVLRESAIHATREGARVGSVQSTEATAQQAATTAVANYLAGARMRAHPATITVTTVAVGPANVRAIDVALVNYPAGSITGFAPTRVPGTITARAVMRLEVQP